MTEISTSASFGFPEAARRLGVPLRVLRRAIRAGHIPAPSPANATATLSAAWLSQAEAAAKASPAAFSRAFTQKVPPFARYEGTSAWRKYTNRVREYAQFRASTAA
jgi:hypothetical protein